MFALKASNLYALAALLHITAATTAPGFPLSASSDLGLTFGANTVSPPGELISRPDTASPPNITSPLWTSAGRGIIMMVDIDVPRNGTRVQLLHWLASGVTISPSNNNTLVVPSTAEASYLQPSPPVGDTPHAYTILLFSQPANFSVPAQFEALLQSRVFFNTSGFVEAAGLGQAVAANYFRVQNLTGTPTQSFPPPSSPSNTSTQTPMPFPGGAARVGGLWDRGVWVGLGIAVVAGGMAFAL